MLVTVTPLLLCKYSTLVKTVSFGGAVTLCLPSLLISMPPAALRILAGQRLACCYFIPSLWVSKKAVKLLRNMFWAAKGLRSFALSLYPVLLAMKQWFVSGIWFVRYQNTTFSPPSIFHLNAKYYKEETTLKTKQTTNSLQSRKLKSFQMSAGSEEATSGQD